MNAKSTKYISKNIESTDAKRRPSARSWACSAQRWGCRAGIFPGSNDIVALLALGSITAGCMAIPVFRAIDHDHLGACREESLGERIAGVIPDIRKLEVNIYVQRAIAPSSEQVAREYAPRNAMLVRVATDKFEAIQEALHWLRTAPIGGYCEEIVRTIAKVAARGPLAEERTYVKDVRGESMRWHEI